jgi:tripartite-type tricarboxylate transporter receptor subunit TctC
LVKLEDAETTSVDAVNACLFDPKTVRRFAELGGAPLVLSPTAFAKLVIDETDKWARVIRAANIRPE